MQTNADQTQTDAEKIQRPKFAMANFGLLYFIYIISVTLRILLRLRLLVLFLPRTKLNAASPRYLVRGKHKLVNSF
jgi:hypothetical protein